jgi:uncharacterized repeat protein (TIGR03843 family)
VPELTPAKVLGHDDALVLLSLGEVRVEGRITSASNATLYCGVEHDGIAAAAVYKPVSGERPLWDFPTGTLAERELASYAVSVATGWDIVPPTVLREGPLGFGMVQLWVDTDDAVDLIGAINGGRSAALQRVALLDAVINNSDRKVSHLLPVPGNAAAGEFSVHGIDHGVSFSVEHKLRTVLWQWAGDPISDDGLEMLDRLALDLDGKLGEQLGELLTTAEVRAASRRVTMLRRRARFPRPPSDWPAVPYPPY